MAEEDALVLYILTSVTAKAEDCETVRAGMGFACRWEDGEM